MTDFYKRMAEIELSLHEAFLSKGDKLKAAYHKQEYDNYMKTLKSEG